MRDALIILLAVLTLLCPAAATAQAEASPDQMEERGGLVHKAGEQAPFTGIVRDLHQSGKPRLEASYAAGKLASSKVWYENGQLAEEVAISGETWNIRRFAENGHLEEEILARFSAGKKVSEQTRAWDEAGQLRNEVAISGGKLHGVLKEYDSSGVLVREELYEHGKLVKKTK
jgi:antitoxin component YwqK of YwqJK toxin-antitoxin module